MFGFNKKVKINDKIDHFDSIVNKGMVIHGPVDFTGSFQVFGEIGGNISGVNKGNTLSVAKGAHVNGNIKSDVVIIDGTVNGDIDAMSVSISGNAVITGKAIRYKHLKIEPGAKITAALVCTDTARVEENKIQPAAA